MNGARRCLALVLLTLLSACAGTADVRDLGFWGLGWQFTAVQNRLQPAIPPVLAFARQRHPGLRAAEVPVALGREFRAAILNAPAVLQDRLDRRLVGAFAVSGLPCAGEAQPVLDGGRAVGAFLLLDAATLSSPPDEWKRCPPGQIGGGGDRVAALRDLIATLVDSVVPARLSAGH